MTPITVWQRKNEKGIYLHNHIEDGHVADDVIRPSPKCEVHKSAWNKGDWKKQLAELTNSVPPVIRLLST